MKVLIVATVQSHICQFHQPLVKMLHEHNVEVHVAARDNLQEKNGLKLDFVDKIYNIPFSRSPKSRDNIKAYKELKKIITQEKYDIVNCNTPMGGIITRLACRKLRKQGTKVYYTAHGFHFYKGAPKKNWLFFYPIEKWFANHYTDKVITITKEDYSLALKKFKCNVEYIHGVGVNSSKYSIFGNDVIKQFKIENDFKDKFLFLCTGELNSNKNQSLIINAMPLVLKEIKNAVLLLAGNGPKQKDLEELINNLHVQDNVKLLGYRTDLEKFVNSCDIVVSASIREGLPVNIMEAMICGKPVIVSNNRGHRELLDNQKNGEIIQDFDSKIFAEKMILLSKQKVLCSQYVSNAKSSIENYKDYNVKKELEKIFELE